MLGDAIKRLEYVAKQLKEPFVSPDGEPTDSYWILFETIQVLLLATGYDQLASELRNTGGLIPMAEVFQALRDNRVTNTPFDKLIPWTYREITRAYAANLFAAPGFAAKLATKGAAILQWQEATRTDINKLSGEQVLDAVKNWTNAPKPANLSYADLSGASLSYANLRGANLDEANLTGAKLTNADFNENTVMPDGSYWASPAGFGRWR